MNTVLKQYATQAEAEAAKAAAAVEAKPLEALPDNADDLPEALAAVDAQRMLQRLERAIVAAERDEKLALVGTLTQKQTALLEHIRKATPPAKPDPNENPDMIAARDEAVARFDRLLQQALDQRRSAAFDPLA